jgi:hypothetical protein
MTGGSARQALSDLRNELMKQRDAMTEEAKKEPMRVEIRRLGDEIDTLDFENTRAVAASLDEATRSVETLVATAKLDPSNQALQKLLGRLADAASEAAETLGGWFGPRAFVAAEKYTAQPLLDFALPAVAAGAAAAGARASGASSATAAAATAAAGALPAFVKGSKLSELADDYTACWSACVVDEARVAAVNRSVDRLLQGEARYKAVGKRCNGVPWQLIGIMHGLECGYDFGKHLHNGDPLSAPTRRVPAGRPPGWNGTGPGKTAQRTQSDGRGSTKSRNGRWFAWSTRSRASMVSDTEARACGRRMFGAVRTFTRTASISRIMSSIRRQCRSRSGRRSS